MSDRRHLAVVIGLGMGLVSNALAAVVNNDFLAGAGDFEKSTYVRWYSFTSGIYDPAKDPNVLYYYVSSPQSSGYSKPSTDDSVADGWIRVTGRNVNPGTGVIYRVTSNPAVGSGNCQYIAIRNTAGDTYLDKHVPVDNSKPYRLHTGDTITFKIDRIVMTDYSGLPQGAAASFFMGIAGIAPPKQLTPSGTAFSDQITTVIPAGVTDIRLEVYVMASGSLANKQPGMYIDGAHLYVKRAGAGDYEHIDVPVATNRSIVTQNVGYSESRVDTYKAVRDHDAIGIHESDYDAIALLRYYNPNIELYLYESGACFIDYHDDVGRDVILNSSPMSFLEAKSSHPEWLYSSGANTFRSYSWASERYYARVTNSGYQDMWAQRVIDKVGRLGVNGVWIDDLDTLTPSKNVVTRDPWEIQQFLHAVCPKLKAAGLEVIENACTATIQNTPDNVFAAWLVPFWTPNGTFPASSGYSANSAANTPDTFFQECAFFTSDGMKANAYDRAYWYRCLQDMDTIAQWHNGTSGSGSALLGPTDKRLIHMWVVGVDTSSDPAYGTGGWLQFGLASFLLGPNDWALLGCALKGPIGKVSYPDIDYSITKKLGIPDGGHQAYGGDTYFRYRRYASTAAGGLGGIVLVNGNTDVSRSYTTQFDATDEAGTNIPAGTVVTLKPHTGRILLKVGVQVDVRIATPSQNVLPGQVVDVRVDYANRGLSVLNDVILRAQVPDQTSYVSGSAEQSSGRYDASTDTVSWTIPQLAAGASGTKVFKVRVK